MPFLKFSRDKRGYEYFSLVEPIAARRGKASRPRILFWFRTPPQVKVGREPFTDEVRRAIEAQNPGLRFDWAQLMATPIPSADAEHWRERRRAERASRQAVLGAEGGEHEDDPASVEPRPNELPHQDGPDGGAGHDRPDRQEEQQRDDRVNDGADEGSDEGGDRQEPLPAETTVSASESAGPAATAAPASGGGAGSGRRRRRRGRRNRPQTLEPVAGTVAPNVPVPPTEEV